MSTTWAVVTGASSGLGIAYAERLAADGANVILVARSEDKLQKVAENLRQRHGVETMVLPADLTDRQARASLIDTLGGLQISTLVNNAGFATFGDVAEIDPDRMSREVELNVVALTDLTRALIPQMIDRGRGAVINIASTAAFQPIPGMAVYAATKGYVLQFTVALWAELKKTGVRALCVCPGPTETEFFTAAGDDSVMGNRRTPEQVVDSTFDALKRHRPFVVDGAQNKLLAVSTRLAPKGLAATLAKFVATH